MRPVMGTLGFLILFLFSNPLPLSLILSILPVLLGEYIRLVSASSGERWQRAYTMETHRVVKRGIYSSMRHPFYLGNFFIISGFIIMFNPPLFIKVSFIFFASLYLFVLAKFEEMELTNKVDYKKYKEEVPFISFNIRGKINKDGFRQEIITIIILVIVYCTGIAKFFVKRRLL